MVLQRRALRRAGLTLVLSCLMGTALALGLSFQRNAAHRARLDTAERQLLALTDGHDDDERRAAIAWGYSERQRLGLESPFRLIEAASRDPRLTAAERRTVSWALLAHVVRGETHEIDPAALDQRIPSGDDWVAGEAHLAAITRTIEGADDPRAGELAVRLGYALAVAERIVDGSASALAGEAAALIADRETSRREARGILRSARDADPIEQIRTHRAQRRFYVERPVLMAPDAEVEDDAIRMIPTLLTALRSLKPGIPRDSVAAEVRQFGAPRLYAAGAQLPPSAPLVVTVQRHVPTIRRASADIDLDRLRRAANGEMLVAALTPVEGRVSRRAVGRMVLATAVAMRSHAQEPVWFPDSIGTGDAVETPFASVEFDPGVPRAWRPYYLSTLAAAAVDLRRVLPALKLDEVRVRFGLRAPADSALAMHDPRLRMLHLPIGTAAGTLTHELAHDIDRQSAIQQGVAGYRSDVAARATRSPSANRVAASLRALTDERAETGRGPSRDRPAEIFATRVDWFVARALAGLGLTNGYLSAVQDELLTGHVVHLDRLRGSGRANSLISALGGMTSIAPFALVETPPTAQMLLRWSLGGPVDRSVATRVVRGEREPWPAPFVLPAGRCEGSAAGRPALVRLAAESRARGWLRQRALWMEPERRPPWARSVLGQFPWSDTLGAERVAQLRDHILQQLAMAEELAAGLSAYAAPVAAQARCGK